MHAGKFNGNNDFTILYRLWLYWYNAWGYQKKEQRVAVLFFCTKSKKGDSNPARAPRAPSYNNYDFCVGHSPTCDRGAVAQNVSESPWGYHERNRFCPVDKSGFFQLYSPAASYIALQLYSSFRRVILRFAQFGGEYNITSRVSEKYNCPEGTI